MESTLRRTWAEIDLDALKHNYKTLRALTGEKVKFLGVVKADAYGHGAVEVGSTLQTLGCDYLAVSSLDEAMELRHGGITMPILILGHTLPSRWARSWSWASPKPSPVRPRPMNTAPRRSAAAVR